MKAIDIPAKFPIPFAKNAGPGFIRTIPVPSSPTPGAASFNDGFSPLNFLPLSGGGVPPFGQDANGILFMMSSWDQWFSTGGPVPWDSTYSTNIGGYPAGAIVASSTLGNFFICTTDDNTSNPNTGGANWAAFSPCNLYAVDGGGADALTAALFPVPPTYASLTGFPVRIKKAASANTGAVTIDLNGLGVKPIVHADGSALAAGELPSAGIISIVYDGTNFQLQSTPASSVTPTQLQVQAGNFAVDSGSANALAITLSPVPASLAAINGSPIRIKKAGSASTTAVTLNVNTLGAQPIKHADGTDMQVGELPANGLFEVAWDNAATRFTLLSPPLAAPVPSSVAQAEAATNNTTFLTPGRMPYSMYGVKGWVIFRYVAGVLTVSAKSDTVLSVSRVTTGQYTIQMQGGLNFVFGYALANGGGGPHPGAAGFIGSGSRATGVDPAFTVRFGDAGGSGGQASDPTDAGVIIFGQTQN